MTESQDDDGHTSRIEPPLTLDVVLRARRTPEGHIIDAPTAVTAIGHRIETIEWAEPGKQWVERLPIPEEGDLARLKALAERLAGDYHWQAAAAAAFVLSDLVPPIRSLSVSRGYQGFTAQARGRHRSIITIRAEAWVQPRDVLAAYQKARAETGSAKAYPITEKAARLVTFIEGLPPQPWKDRLTHWNTEGANSPDETYEERELRRFIRDCHRARNQIGPLLVLSGDQPQGLAAAERVADDTDDSAQRAWS